MNKQNPQRIDVHHHVLPPDFMAYLDQRGEAWTGGPAIPHWNVSIGREVMDRNGIASAVASVVPQVDWGNPAEAAHWARHGNEFLARIVHDDPAHFGGFATLPLPDTAAAVKEVEHAYDELKLDGVILFASQGNRYLGDPGYEELFQELERRKAIVLIHPNTITPGASVPKVSIPWGVIEFTFDTTRAVTNLLFTGTLQRYPSIRYILSHAGGTIPFVALRIALSMQLPGHHRMDTPEALRQLRRLYYDTALSTSEFVFGALKEFAPPGHVLFGSDYPMVEEKVVKTEVSMIESSQVLDDAARSAIDRGNALALFPRFGKTSARPA